MLEVLINIIINGPLEPLTPRILEPTSPTKLEKIPNLKLNTHNSFPHLLEFMNQDKVIRRPGTMAADTSLWFSKFISFTRG